MLAVAALALAAAGLSACSSGPSAAQVTGAAASCKNQGAEGSAKGPATISIAYSSTQEFNSTAQAASWFTQLKSAFQKAHPGVTVKLEPIGGSYNNFVQKINLMLRSPSTAPDVIHEATVAVGSQVEAGQLAPLEGYLKNWPGWKQFPQSVRLGGIPGPQVWQMVSGLVDFGFYYNVNQFKAAGIPVPWQPTSWAQVLAAARQIKQKVPGTIPLWVYAGNQVLDQTTRENFLPLLQGTGSPVTKGFKWVASSKGLLDTFNLYHSIFAGGLGPSTSDLANPAADGEVDGTLMPKQKVAIALVGNWDGSWWIKGGAAPFPQGVNTYKVAALPTENGQAPGLTTQAQGSTFVLTCASKHRVLAAELMEMAENPHFNLLHVLWTGEVPPRADVLANPAYTSSVPYYNSAEASWEKHAVLTPSYNYDPYSTCIGEVTGNIEANGLSGPAALQQFKSCLTRAIGASGVVSLGT
ncbi:MAG: ABC transporter substrate-binding protein [Streptosporangiaceae bacterium]